MSDDCCSPRTNVDDTEEAESISLWKITEIRLAAISGLFLVAGLVSEGRLSTGFFVLGIAVGGWTFIPESIVKLRHGKLGVGTLMTIAAIGAIALGDFGEAASLAFLFSISEALEGWAMAKTRRGLRALLSLVPPMVTVSRNGVSKEIDPSELVVGDVMVIKPGERVATDGVVLKGQSAVDLSAVTGESMPIEIGPGSDIAAAALNGSGILEVEVKTVTADSSLARIVHIVEEAQDRKGSGQRLAERVAKPLVPGILVVAFLIAVIGSLIGDPEVWLTRSLVVLVAAAPCAFAISVPITVVAAVGSAAKMGALIKGGAALEELSQVRVVALDKTGTLTQNRPQIIETLSVGDISEERVLQVAAALEAHSEHPLAAAILEKAAGNSVEAENVSAVVGNGIEGAVEGQPARLGKPGFIEPGELSPRIGELQEAGATVVLVEHNSKLLGLIAVRDELRPEAKEVIQGLRKLNVRHIAMLTGDNKRTASALGEKVGVDAVHSELLPEDKVRVVSELQKSGSVAMVGDGINDAPALATANVGIAMGAMGSDVAIEAADVALMGEELVHLPEVLFHSRRAGRIMKQNLALSAAILLALIPLAAGGVLQLAAVVAAHEIAEVFVIANGVRAGRKVRFKGYTRKDVHDHTR